MIHVHLIPMHSRELPSGRDVHHSGGTQRLPRLAREDFLFQNGPWCLSSGTRIGAGVRGDPS
jgi:hypothetical protein